MIVSCIVAVSDNRVIGCGNRLPWHLPADLKRFKKLSMGHHIIMGRKTFESIGRLLPGRTSIVITRNPKYEAPGAVLVLSLDEAFEKAASDDEVFVIGGEAIFEQALPRADRLYLTRVHASFEGDVFFPACDLEGWTLKEDARHEPDTKNRYAYSFRVYERENRLRARQGDRV